MNKRHFSLIELLITIAVIAILAGLLMPALNMAKQKAIDLHCINNLKQFGTAFMTYRSDSEDKMPMWSSDLYPIYMASAKTYECKRDMNRKNITFPSTEWRLNVPGAATDERKFVEAYDYPSSQAEEGRSVPADDPRRKLKISYFYEFAATPASWELAEKAKGATWWELKYYQIEALSPKEMIVEGMDPEQKKLFEKDDAKFKTRLATFPVLRCFWHMKGMTPESDNTPVYNLSYDGSVFYSGPPAWEVNSWTQK